MLNWPGGAASRRSVRAVAKLSPLKALMASLGDKSLRPHLDALLDLLMQVTSKQPPMLDICLEVFHACHHTPARCLFAAFYSVSC